MPHPARSSTRCWSASTGSTRSCTPSSPSPPISPAARPPTREARYVDARARGDLDALPPLLGVPVSIKDLHDVAGVRTTQGSKIFADHIADSSGIPYERLEAAGAVLLGKTNTPEFGLVNRHRELARRSRRHALESGARGRRLQRGGGSGRRGRSRTSGAWQRRRRLHPPPGRLQRRCGNQAHPRTASPRPARALRACRGSPPRDRWRAPSAMPL